GQMHTMIQGPIGWQGPCHWITMSVSSTGQALLSAALENRPGCDFGWGIYTIDLTQPAISVFGPQPLPWDGAQLQSVAIVPDQAGGTCNADFDGDGDIGTDADINAFFQCLGGNCCPTCGSPD